NPNLEPEAINPLEELGIGQKAKLVTIPTTSGTGSEVTHAVVLTDTKAGRKYPFLSKEMLASIAIVDPQFALAMPPRLVSDTGLDALAHSVEAYTCSWRNDFADSVCLKAISLIFNNLVRSYNDATDEEAREHMHNAASLAGLAILNSVTSFGHAVGHSFGAVFHVPHGRCSGLFLPYAMEFIAPQSAPRLAEISRHLGLAAPGVDDYEATDLFVKAVRDLETKLQAPSCVKDMGISRADYEKQLERLVDFALNDSQIVSSPRPPEPHEMEKLFWHVYDGTPIKF
ncbi:MAG: iron-containing alcohol dehydrogenase, partial [Rudaea sp.]